MYVTVLFTKLAFFVSLVKFLSIKILPMINVYLKLTCITAICWTAFASPLALANTPTPPNAPEFQSLSSLVSKPQYVDSLFFAPQVQALESASALPVSQKALANKIADKYDVSPSVAQEIVTVAHTQAEANNIDPLLVLSVIAAESSFNPKAKNSSGAMGLMQAIPRWHRDKIKNLGLSNNQLLAIEPNVRLGVVILKEYLRLSNGNMTQALQKYNGSSKDRSQSYNKKIMRHYHWFAQSG